MDYRPQKMKIRELKGYARVSSRYFWCWKAVGLDSKSTRNIERLYKASLGFPEEKGFPKKLKITEKWLEAGYAKITVKPAVAEIMCNNLTTAELSAFKGSMKLFKRALEKFGINPDHVEAMAFAWLAYQNIHQQTGNLPSVTGAKESVILGTLTNHTA